MKLIYLPLEKYRERYTEFLSDMVMSYLTEYSIPSEAIIPNYQTRTIKAGKVLDPLERCGWGFSQTEQLVRMILDGTVVYGDVIYIEDFWHPGFEMIPYTMAQVYGHDKTQWPRIFTFCHAQSVDPHDFTHPMRWWMRDIELGWAKCNTGIFVAARELGLLLREAGVSAGSIIEAGTVFRGEILRDRFFNPAKQPPRPSRIQRVVFSSRFDEEKDPLFFCKVAETILKERKDIHFIVCSGRLQLTNDEALNAVVKHMKRKYSFQFEVRLGMQKADYYRVLNSSAVQFNCAKQDFVSYTLLEAAYYGCYPVYPHYLTFPDALNHNRKFMYTPGNITEACEKIIDLIDHPGAIDPLVLTEIYGKYQRSFLRMLKTMGFTQVPHADSLEEEHLDARAEGE